MSDERIIKSYVWHENKCFFVSTIERDSSAMLGPRRYNETLVWEYDWAKHERGEQIGQAEAPRGCIGVHQRIVTEIFERGFADYSL